MPTQIAVLKETAEREQRVALMPDAVAKLVKNGATIVVERGAGTTAGASDDAYAQAGAKLSDDARSTCAGANVTVKVQPPSVDEAALLEPGSVLVSLLPLADRKAVLDRLVERKVTALALERVPRITRAQSMDVLSSQATLSGYKAVLLGASALPRILPMMTTAAGNLTPAKTFVIGAGVAGLQAIATAKRLGAVVTAFDVRAAVKEQVQSVGATFVGGDLASEAAQDKGGYAKVQSDDEQTATLKVIAGHIKDMDLVISTAAIPGKRAPILITAAMVESMKPSSVIIDLAADTGGNCELSKPGETVERNGVRIVAPLNLASTLPMHASQMFSRNILTLMQHLVKDGNLTIDVADEIAGPMAVTHAGELRV